MAAVRPRTAVRAQSIEVKELPELHVACVPHIGAYQGIGQAFEKLMRWAGPRGLLRFTETKSLAVYRDSPDVTETDKLRSDACITVPEGTKVDGEIGEMRIPGGTSVAGRFEIAADQFKEAWDALRGGGCRAPATSPTTGCATRYISTTPSSIRSGGSPSTSASR
jgi:DNA gyrase inhibitor GyrI